MLTREQIPLSTCGMLRCLFCAGMSIEMAANTLSDASATAQYVQLVKPPWQSAKPLRPPLPMRSTQAVLQDRLKAVAAAISPHNSFYTPRRDDMGMPQKQDATKPPKVRRWVKVRPKEQSLDDDRRECAEGAYEDLLESLKNALTDARRRVG